jgi:HD-like signal output (HDOD) protein
MIAELAINRDTILQHAQALPAAPQVLGGLCELLEDPNTDLDQISADIRVDAALAGRVIRLSNSVLLGGRAPVASVEEAVNRVGFSEIVRLVGLATVSNLVDRSLTAYGVPADRLRESFLLHALASEALAEPAQLEPRAAYAAGLLRGVGMMVLDRLSRGRIVYDPAAFPTYGDWEQACFNTRGVSVTMTILKDWRFPLDTVNAIRQHLSPESNRLAAVMNLAGAIVARHGLELAGEASCWAVTPEKLALAGIDEGEWQAVAERVGNTFEIQRQALN